MRVYATRIYLAQGQHSLPWLAWCFIVDITSRKEGICSSLTSPAASSMAALALAALQGQHPRGVKACGLGGLYSQAGFSQTSSHFGLGHINGFLHFQSQLVASHKGAHFGFGAMQAVWQTGGEQTVSHFGQSSFSHKFFGHLTEQAGFSQ